MRSETFNTNAKIANDLKTKRIAELNDKLRSEIFNRTETKNQIVLTNGVSGYEHLHQVGICKMVSGFQNFNEDNNPHKERDFGAFEYGNTKFFWKIDYYDNDLSYHSEDKSDPDKTTRVLTVMKASEY